LFNCLLSWLKESGFCDSLRDVYFIEIHDFGCQP
jgi:hypothetical protein